MAKIDEAVKEYLDLRAQKKALEAQHKEELSGIKSAMADLENRFSLALERTGLTSLPTAFGTPYESIKTSASVADRDAYLDFVITNQAWQLLPSSVNVVALTELVEEGTPVPGVNVTSVRKINVRTGGKK